MCLAIPALIKTIDGQQAEVDIEGIGIEPKEMGLP